MKCKFLFYKIFFFFAKLEFFCIEFLSHKIVFVFYIFFDDKRKKNILNVICTHQNLEIDKITFLENKSYEMAEIFSVFDQKSLGVNGDQNVFCEVEELQTLLDVLPHPVQCVLLIRREVVAAAVRLDQRPELLQTTERRQVVIQISVDHLILKKKYY